MLMGMMIMMMMTMMMKSMMRFDNSFTRAGWEIKNENKIFDIFFAHEREDTVRQGNVRVKQGVGINPRYLSFHSHHRQRLFCLARCPSSVPKQAPKRESLLFYALFAQRRALPDRELAQKACVCVSVCVRVTLSRHFSLL